MNVFKSLCFLLKQFLKMSSSSLIVLISFVTLAYGKLQIPADLQDYADSLHDLCIKRTGITEDDHIAYDIANNPHDEKLQCYIKCLMMEANWMSPDGVIQYDWIEENIHQDIKDIIVTALRKCKVINEGANLCEKASHFNACMYAADSDNWFLV